MIFEITYGGVRLPEPFVQSYDLSTPSSEDLLLSEKTSVSSSTQSRLALTVACTTQEVGHISALKAMRGSAAALVIVEDPDLYGLGGVYPVCSIVGFTVTPRSPTTVSYVISFLQDTT